MDFDSSRRVTGPSSNVTFAPSFAKSSAILCPNVPVDRLLMTRIVSMGTHVGPQVIKILLFFSINFSFADDWGDNFKIEEEAYIDDIPFDTEAIVKSLYIDGDEKKIENKPDFEIEEEEYIDDIPFDTKAIFNKIQKSKESCCYKNILCLEEEDYIDDIPFDTKKIFKKYFQCKVYANICK